MVGFTEVLYDAPILKKNIGASCTVVTMLMIIINASDLVIKVIKNARLSLKKKIAKLLARRSKRSKKMKYLQDGREDSQFKGDVELKLFNDLAEPLCIDLKEKEKSKDDG